MIGEQCIYNNKIIDCQKLETLDGEIVYEVIRIINGTPLFLEEHFQRLKNSLAYFGIETIDLEKIHDAIDQLVAAEGIENNNIKMEFGNFANGHYDYMIYLVESYYPEKTIYDQGVKTITINKKREHPTIKVEDQLSRARIKKLLVQQQAFEAILLTENQKVLEGSKSNLFFVKDQLLYTAKDEEVLGGITKQKVVEMMNENDFELIQKDIYYEELNTFDGAFLTGTSIDILPIAQIDQLTYTSAANAVIKKLMKAYERLKQKNIKECC
jgi:branched-chain amino acid aminotransferase